MNASSPPRPMSLSAKLGLLGALYFSQGLPFGFFAQAVPVILRKHGYSLGAIGLSSLLAMPWALKFLWAPAVDRYGSTRFGRRTSWIVPLQATGVLVLLALSVSNVDRHMPLLLGAVFVLNLVAASQDIATDGMAVDMLSPPERGLANGLQVGGYRVGMIVGGGLLLILFERLGSTNTFVAMAAMTALATLPVLLTRERAPMRAPEVRERGGARVVHFLRRPGVGRILAIVIVYKAGDAFAMSMVRPFLVDLGLSMADIGWLLGTVGFAAGLFGALAGGALVNRVGRRRSLVLFGALQAVAVFAYALLAVVPRSTLALYAVSALEHFAGGMATAALFTCMMDWCAPETAATDYTVQASAQVIATGVAASVAGFDAHAIGYFGHFTLAAGIAAVSALAAGRLYPSAPWPAPALTESVVGA